MLQLRPATVRSLMCSPPWLADVIVVEGSKYVAVVPVSRKAHSFITDIREGRQRGQRVEHFQDKAWLAKVAAAGGVVARATGPCALRVKAEHWHCVVNASTCVRWATARAASWPVCLLQWQC